jgi:hypothetical protein
VEASSCEQAEAERKNVEAERLAATLTDFIEWRAFPYWVRLCVKSAGSVSDPTSLKAAMAGRLGLSLVDTRRVVDLVIVDHLEKLP